MDSALDSVEVLWRGTNQQNIGDTLKLYDDGKFGDIIANDNIFQEEYLTQIRFLRMLFQQAQKTLFFYQSEAYIKTEL